MVVAVSSAICLAQGSRTRPAIAHGTRLAGFICFYSGEARRAGREFIRGFLK